MRPLSLSIVRVSLTALVMITAVACSSTGGSTDGADGALVDGTVIDDSTGYVDVPSDLLKPGQICVPNVSVKACVIEGGKLAMVCNASGTGYVEKVCAWRRAAEAGRTSKVR